MKWGLLLPLLLFAFPASAHGSLGDYATSEGAWTTDLGVILPLYAGALLYLGGTWRLWKRAGYGHGVRYAQATSFWSGWIILALALLSPLHWLSEHLFAAHMVEHELLMLGAAPLFVIARPLAALLWACPVSYRQALGRIGHSRIISQTWKLITKPAVITALHGAAIWGWHVPIAFSAALTHEPIHWLQHLSFFITALLFWWSLLFNGEKTGSDGESIFWLFVTAMHTSALGVLLTLSRTPWVPFQTDLGESFGLSPLEDQQLAGLIMWVPSGLIYTIVALLLAARWIRASSQHALRNG